MRQLYTKYKDVVMYGIFGVCTTLVNIAVYWLCAHVFSRIVKLDLFCDRNAVVSNERCAV